MAVPIREIKSLTKAFRVLETLAGSGEMDLGDVSTAVGLPKTSVHRVLVALQSMGYVQQNNQTRGYAVSIKLFELGARVTRRLTLLNVAAPVVAELACEVGETVNLGVLDGLEVVCIHKMDSIHPLRMDQPVGSRDKAYRASMGKAMLACLPDSEIRSLLADHIIVANTPSSVTDVASIIGDLRSVRQRGYAIDKEESILGVCCVGAPILGESGRPLGGLSIAGPTVRMTDSAIDRLGPIVKETALKVGQLICALPLTRC